jgi:hypothetical protein
MRIEAGRRDAQGAGETAEGVTPEDIDEVLREALARSCRVVPNAALMTAIGDPAERRSEHQPARSSALSSDEVTK